MSVFLVVLLVLAVIGTGAMAGVFFAYSGFVIQGLDRMPHASAARIMRSMSLASLRTPIVGTQFGTMLVGFVCTGLAVFGQGGAAAPWIIGATLVQLLGSVVVTAAATMPANDRLANAADDDEVLTSAWLAFRAGWLTWNHVRTAASVLACVGFAIALRLA
ncbi:DUF1772 domain-containing protein [Agromyces sp. MMS24-K17]|uniref:anthrone oxygenase family protein n=1 Tax=Agromyces sp. MMS24-K17 TaxID=3372850 RepID=UPI0037542EA3